MGIFGKLFGNNDKTQTDSQRVSASEERLSFGIKVNQSFIEAATHSLDVALGQLGIQRSSEVLIKSVLTIKENAQSEADFLKRIQQMVANSASLKLIEIPYITKLLESIFLPFSSNKYLVDSRGGDDEVYLVNAFLRALDAAEVFYKPKVASWVSGGYGFAKFSAHFSVMSVPGKPTVATISVSYYLGNTIQLNEEGSLIVSERLAENRFEPIAIVPKETLLGGGFEICFPLSEVHSAYGVSRVATLLKRKLRVAHAEVLLLGKHKLIEKYNEESFPTDEVPPVVVSLGIREFKIEESLFGEQFDGYSHAIKDTLGNYNLLLGDLICPVEYCSGRVLLTIPLNWPAGPAICELCFKLNSNCQYGYPDFPTVSCGAWTVSPAQRIQYGASGKNLTFVCEVGASDIVTINYLFAELNGYLGIIARLINTDSSEKYSELLHSKFPASFYYYWFNSGVKINPRRNNSGYSSESDEEKEKKLQRKRDREALLLKAKYKLASGEFKDSHNLILQAENFESDSDSWRLMAYINLLSGKPEKALQLFKSSGINNNPSDLFASSIASYLLADPSGASEFAKRAADVLR